MNFHIHKRLVIGVALLLVVVGILLCAVLVYKYSEISPGRVINRERVSRLSRNHIVLGPNDVQMITSWMTFDYINHVFGLPPEYLKSATGMNDSQYPHLTLSRYARENKVAPDVFTTQIQVTVKNYFTPPVSQ